MNEAIVNAFWGWFDAHQSELAAIIEGEPGGAQGPEAG